MNGYRTFRVKPVCEFVVARDKRYYILDLTSIASSLKGDLEMYNWCALQPAQESGVFDVPRHARTLRELIGALPSSDPGGIEIEILPIDFKWFHESFCVTIVTRAWRDDYDRSRMAREGKVPFVSFWDFPKKVIQVLSFGVYDDWVLWTITSATFWRENPPKTHA